MSSNPKIIVLKTREIIYTLLLLFLAILLIVCLVLMFSGKLKKSEVQSSTSSDQGATAQPSETSSDSSSKGKIFTAGVYTTPVTLGDSTVDVEVSVDQDHINAIRLVNLSEATAAAFPLVSPSLEHITSQILEKQSIEDITCPQENKYTSQLLLSAIAQALERAQGTE